MPGRQPLTLPQDWGWGPSLRTGVPLARSEQDIKRDSSEGRWRGSRWGSGRTLDHSRGKCGSTFGRYRFVFNYTKFPDFILSYQRHKMPARSDKNKTHVGSRHRKSQWAWASAAASSESCRRPPVRRPLSRLEAEQAWGCPHGRPVPASGPRGSPGAAQRHPPLTPNRCLSVAVLALRRGRAVSGPGWRLMPTRAPGFPHANSGRGREAPPFTLAQLPHSGEESTHRRTAEIVKLNFPDVQAPGACACCLEKRWGLGRATPHALPAHPTLPVPPSTTGCESQLASVRTARPSLPALRFPASLSPSDPIAMLVSGQPQGPRGGTAGARCTSG